MEYREKRNQSKGFELKRLQKEHPDFSPFVLLKLSLIRYGAVLTKRAKKEIVRQNLQFLSDAAFGLQFGEKEEYVIPGPFLLRDGTFVYINYGETYLDPYQIDWCEEQDVFQIQD